MPYKTPFKAHSTLTSKGQITLPVELRRRWGLKPGDRVDFSLDEDGCVVLRKWLRRSIHDIAETLPPLPSLTDNEIEVAAGAKDRRTKL